MLDNQFNKDNSHIEYIFVYGSLMNNFYNYERYLKGLVEKCMKARVKGKLYHLSNKGYPALVDGEDYIYGELLEIKNFQEQLPRMDELEGYIKMDNPSNEYNRVVMEVEVMGQCEEKFTKAYVYKYNECKNKIQEEDIYIPYGDWRKFMVDHISI